MEVPKGIENFTATTQTMLGARLLIRKKRCFGWQEKASTGASKDTKSRYPMDADGEISVTLYRNGALFKSLTAVRALERTNMILHFVKYLLLLPFLISQIYVIVNDSGTFFLFLHLSLFLILFLFEYAVLLLGYIVTKKNGRPRP